MSELLGMFDLGKIGKTSVAGPRQEMFCFSLFQ